MIVRLVLIALLCSFVTNTCSLESVAESFWDVWIGFAKVGLGAVDHVTDIVKSPETLFRLGGDVVLGLPLRLTATFINRACSLALAIHGIKPTVAPKPDKMELQLYAVNGETVSFTLMQADKLWTHEYFNPKWNLTIFITGWLTNFLIDPTAHNAIEIMRKPYMQRGGINFVVLNSAQYIDTLYTWSAFNTEKIGYDLGVALASLDRLHSGQQIHLIGHSLGAHIAGAAGRSFEKATGKILPRITGLDPANPCFNEGESLSKLHRGDAAFVDVIHTNNGVFGERDALADADFYPNGQVSIQPGCIIISCSHERAWEFYAESVYPGNENNFMAVRCNSILALSTRRCPGEQIPMGFAVLENIKGSFYLTTESNKPFGRGTAGG